MGEEIQAVVLALYYNYLKIYIYIYLAYYQNLLMIIHV